MAVSLCYPLIGMKKFVSFFNGFTSDYRDRLDTIRRIGYDGVFFIFEGDPNFYAALDYAQEIGLLTESIHLPFYEVNTIWKEGPEGDEFIDSLLRGVRVAAQKGIERAVVHISSSPICPQWTQQGMDRMRRVVALADELGVQLCMENTRHNNMLDRYFAEVEPSPYVGFCLDFGHLNGFTHDPLAERWVAYADRVSMVHIHDNDGTGDQHLLPFDGTLPWEELVPIVFKGRTDIPLLLELTETARTKYPDLSEEEFLRVGYARLERIEQLILKN